MNRLGFILMLAFVFCTQPNFADDLKRRSAVQKVIDFELGPNAIFSIKESIFKDTIRLKANDSINIPKALAAFNSLQHDFVDNCAKFVALFPAGTKHFKPELLDDSNLTSYKVLAKKMRKGLNGYRELVESVNNYQPYQQRRLDESYEVKNGNGEILQFQASYFFDSEDNLERYFWLSAFDKKSVMGMINLAGKRNYEFIETILEQVGIQFGQNLITYIISDEDNRLPDEEVLALREGRKSQIKKQTIRASKESNGTSSQSSIISNNNSTAQNTSHYTYNEHHVYIVKKDICGATFTKEAMKQFTHYSIHGKNDGIKNMLATGELIVLRKGQKVIMVEPGYVLSRVMLSNGKTVYTDTENITKQQ